MRNPPTICGICIHLQIPHTIFADSTTFAGFTYILRIPLTFFGIHLQLRNLEQLATFACCGNSIKINVPTKFTLQLYACEIH